MGPSSSGLQAIAARALEYVADGDVVGLGTGHAATAFIETLGQRVAEGFGVRGIATSDASAELAGRLGIRLTSFDEVEAIDVDIDGADEVDPQLNLIKGYGAALLREKVVASASRRVVILVGPEKIVPVIGSRGKLPVEVVPFGLAWCARELERLGLPSEPRRRADGDLLLTDNGNAILDCRVGPLERPRQLDEQLRALPGVVGTGLFIGLAHTVLIDRGDHVEVRERSGA
ncbi:MAG TPA: ribose-5-phosphate isomerase RpiA [Pirellulales bacterium]